MSGSLVALIEKNPGTYDITQLYDPLNPAATQGLIFPAVGSTVWQNTVPYKVTAADPVLLTYTLAPAVINTDLDGGDATFVSYQNNILRAFYDTRSTPYRLTIDAAVTVNGTSPSTYQVIRYPTNPAQRVVISQYYDSTGTFVSNLVPLQALSNSNTVWSCGSCLISSSLVDGEELEIDVFNNTGALVATVGVFAKQSSIINDTYAYQPKIASLNVRSVQTSNTGQIYCYQQQSLTSLNLIPFLTYVDGTTLDLVVDNTKTMLYGSSDFVSSFSGLMQNLSVKYFLSSNIEVVAGSTTTPEFLQHDFTVQVVPNLLSAPLKITTVPYWDPASLLYRLRFFCYDTQGHGPVDVSSLVTVSPALNGTDYINTQTLTLGVDMSQVFPQIYTTPTQYTQNEVIKLQPYTAYVRWTLRDSVGSSFTYGADGATSRRPVLGYDPTVQLYFIPSSIFQNSQALLTSFYVNATPPYDPTTVSGPRTPTHFLVRNAFTGTMISATPQLISAYNTGFVLNNGTGGNYVGSVVLIEFIWQTSTTSTVLYGVPVDVISATYTGT